MEKKTKVQELLGSLTKNLECSICLDLLNNPVSTKCDHPFCRFCILEFLEKKRSVPCPLCKAPITKRSLNERPQLNSMVEGVRKLIQAFQEDTGAVFSPPRGPQLLNLTPNTPDQLPCKITKGTKRKIIVYSPKNGENRQNCRQSKRRKSLNLKDEVEITSPSTSNENVNHDHTDLLKYLDQGSCGAAICESSGNVKPGSNKGEDKYKHNKTKSKCRDMEGVDNSHDNTGDDSRGDNSNNRVDKQKNKNWKEAVEQNKTSDAINQELPVHSKLEKNLSNSGKSTSKKSKSNTNKVDSENAELRSYSLRTPKNVNYTVKGPEIDESPRSQGDLYNFNDSPVTPVRSLRHQRKCVQVSQNKNMCSENNSKMDKFKNSKTELMPRSEAIKPSENKQIRKNGSKNIDETETEPPLDFHPRERTLFETDCRKYTRHKIKPTSSHIYSKVNSWLHENMTKQRNGSENEEEVITKGNNLLPDDISGNSVILNSRSKNPDHVIEINDDIVDEKGEEKPKRVRRYEKPSNSKYEKTKRFDDTENINHNQADTEMAEKVENERPVEKEISISHDDPQYKPIVSNKRKIFKTKPTSQTTSVCQKKGVLVIKKVLPNINDTQQHTDIDKINIGDKETDPFEFKSSQKTPVIPESKKSKSIKNKQKNKVKGKLVFRQEESGKENGNVATDIGGNNLHTDIENKEILDRGIGDNNVVIVENKYYKSKQRINKPAMLVDQEKSMKDNMVTVNDTDSVDSVIPGTLDDATDLTKNQKKKKKLGQLSSKLRKKQEDDINSKKNMEKLIEKINDAEDFDLLTCTQEVMQDMDRKVNSGKFSSESVIPDTAELHRSLRRKKSVSFANDIIEISGTPRQTRRSVPMTSDLIRMLPKETKQGARQLYDPKQCKVTKNPQKEKAVKNGSKQPFVWEEGGNSDGSSSTDDLDINPSQDEFEKPSQDVQQSSQDNDENQKDIQSQATTGQSLKVSPRRNYTQITEACNSSMSHENQISKITQDEIFSGNESDVYMEHTQQSGNECSVENTQQDEPTDLQIEDTEVKVVPESVDEIMVDENVNDNLEEKNNDDKNNEVVENDRGGRLMTSNKKDEINFEKMIINNFEENKNDHTHLKQNKGNITTQNNNAVISQVPEFNKTESQSTVSTTDGNVTSDNPVRKSRKKLRARKNRSQDSNVSLIDTPSLIEETPVMMKKPSEGKDVEFVENTTLRNKTGNENKVTTSSVDSPSLIGETPILRIEETKRKDRIKEPKDTSSDTCSISQESVSILLPIKNHGIDRGDNFKSAKGDNTRIDSVDARKKDSSDKVEGKIPSYLEKSESSEKNISSENSVALRKLNKEKITKSDKRYQSGLNKHVKHRHKNENSDSTSEIYDSDIEFISQSNINECNKTSPIVLSGTQTCPKYLQKKFDNIDTIAETMETEDENEMEINVQKIFPNTNDSLPPTLVSQRTLNLRNSAEKKRRSAERQLEQKSEKDDHLELNSENYVNDKHGSPEDIFLMDSELQSSGTDMMPQNPEGLICLDVEPSETLITQRSIDRDSMVLLDSSENEDIIKQGSIKKIGTSFKENYIDKEAERAKLMQNIPSSRQNKVDEISGNLTNQDINFSDSNHTGEKISRKRTVRGLARKKNSLKLQNSPNRSVAIETDISPDGHNEINGQDDSEVKCLYKMPESKIISTPGKGIEGDRNDTMEFGDKIKIRTKEQSSDSAKNDFSSPNHKHSGRNKKHTSEISPTFTYSPQKPNRKKQVKLNRNSVRDVNKEQTPGSQIVHIDDSDSDVAMDTDNKFERLLKDDIADTEMSDEEVETIREDKLNFSDNLTITSVADSKSNKILSKDLNKLVKSKQDNITLDHVGSESPKENIDVPSSLPEINEVSNSPQSSTPLTGKNIFNKVKKVKLGFNFKKRKVALDVDEEGELKKRRDEEEASSPLPDLIGNDHSDKQQNVQSDSEDEDAILIKSKREIYDSDDDSKHPMDLNQKEKSPDGLDVQDESGSEKCDEDGIVTLDEKSDDEIMAVKKKRPNIIEDDSDLSDGSEGSSTSHHLNYTSSSAFSSQSEPISTQQRQKIESEIERMKREMKELEAQLALGSVNSGNTSSISQKKQDRNGINPRATTSVIDNHQEDGPASSNSSVIQEYQSDEELFLSPQPPDPPLSPQQIDLTNEETDFTSEFRKHELELSPVKSSPREKKYDMIENRENKKDLIEETTVNSCVLKENENDENTAKNISKGQCSELSKENDKLLRKNIITPKPSKLMYSPLISNQKSPQLSPAMERKRQKVLSPLVSNTKETPIKSNKCFVSTGLAVPQMKELHKLAVLNQCQFHTKFNEDVTHVIVKTDPVGSRVCDRTLKFFQGISQKCWILDYQWVIDSRVAGHLLSEEDYEIKGDTVTEEFHFGPKRARLSSTRPLFDGIQFLVLGTSKGLQSDDLKSLLTSCGGVVKSDIKDLIGRQNSIVITCSDYDNEEDDSPSPDELSTFKEFYDKYGHISVSREWILDSLTVYRLQPVAEYILTPGKIERKHVPTFDRK